MKQIFKEWGGTIIIVIAIVALIGLVALLMQPGGVLNGAFSNIVQSFVDKSGSLIDLAGNGSGDNGWTDDTGDLLDNTWPLEWNTKAVMENTTAFNGMLVRVSGLVPTHEQLIGAQGTTIYNGNTLVVNYASGQISEGAEIAIFTDDSNFFELIAVSVQTPGEYSFEGDTATFPVPGTYVINFGHEDALDIDVDIVVEIEENPFPIEWNTLDVVGNTSLPHPNDPNERLVKVSSKTPSPELMATASFFVTTATESITVPYPSVQDIDGACLCLYDDGSDDAFPVIVVYSAGEYMGVTVSEPGVYSLDVGSFGVDADIVIGGDGGSIGDADDAKANAYALILDNSGDSSNAKPMIFVREDSAPAVSDTYVSETYGALPVLAVYSDFEDKNYYCEGNFLTNTGNLLLPDWVGEASVTEIVIEDRISPVSTCFWFANKSQCSNIALEKLDTSRVTDMSYTFFNSGFKTLDLRSFDTRNVTDMHFMFASINDSSAKLTSIDMSSFETNSVTDMSYMFLGCLKLEKIKFSNNFSTTNVTDMNNMFGGCSSLENLNLSSFDTRNVTTMENMFASCSGLTVLDLGSFKTGNVKNMSNMFNDCDGLTSLDLRSFNTSKVTDMHQMFFDCSNLKTIDLSSFDTSSVTSMYAMFGSDDNLVTIYVSDLWDTAKVEYDDSTMFRGSSSLVGAVPYDGNYTDVTRANYTTGYLTYKAAP